MVDHGNPHGVTLLWMEVIDEADGFQCFGVELLRARHGSSTLFQCGLGGEILCTLGISSG